MTDYNPVKKALESGADPAMLCATCPWDRNCVTPPRMTSGEIEQHMREATLKDELAAREKPGAMPAASLMTILAFAGRDTALQACPVLSLRLRSGDGRKIAEAVRAQMQSWTDQ